MDSPRAFFQFPIGFSHSCDRRWSLPTHKLSIPYRILTFAIGDATPDTMLLSIPYRILTDDISVIGNIPA